MKHFTSSTIVILTALSILFGCAYYNILFNAKRSYEEGVKEIRKSTDRTQIPTGAKKYFEDTIDKCWKLIDLFSDKSKYADDALLYICKSEFYLEKYTQSKLHLEQFIAKYPNSKFVPEANLWLGKALMKLDEHESADERLRFVINNSNDSKIKSEAYFELGSYEFGNKNYQNAIDYYQKALDEKPDDQYQALLQFNLGEAFYIQKDYDNAIKHFKKVEKYRPSLDVEYRTELHLANSYSLKEKYEDDYRVLHKMLTAPRFKEFIPDIKTAIGENYERQGQYLDAIDIYREIVSEKKPTHGTAQAAFNLAGIYENVYENVDSAVVYYGKVERIYNRFDSLEIAKNKEVFLRELKNFRDDIKKDRRLIYKLENDQYFRDSLYTAQYNDSLKKALGITDTEAPKPKNPATPFPAVSPLGDTTQTALNDSVANDTTSVNDSTTISSIEEPKTFRELEKEKEENLEKEENENRDTASVKTPQVELERRKLPEIKKDLMKTQYQLAEYYLLKVENYDSAKFYFKRFLSQYQDTLLTPKALYSLRFIYSQPGHQDSVAADSLESVILSDYPQSTFTKVILKQNGLLNEEEDENSLDKKAQHLFLEAESLYFAQQFDDALRKYEEVSEMDSSSELGAKAMYAQAWIYEKELHQKQLALNTYEKIIQDYPSASEYLAIAKKKTTPPKETSPAAPTGGEASGEIITAKEDTVQAVNQTGVAGESVQENDQQVASHIIAKDKILWRMRRYRK